MSPRPILSLPSGITRLMLAAAASALAWGCAGGSDKEKPAKSVQDAPGGLQALRIDTTRCDARGLRADQVDLNHDGRADLVSVYQKGGGAFACRQADFNFDGRVDAYFHYDDKGVIAREQFDTDFDGRIDMGRIYEEGALVLDEQDLNNDGYVDAWRRYDKGRLLRIETDRDADGRADTFSYYVAGRIDRVGYDVNGDGKVDQWDHDAARRARLAEDARKAARTDADDEQIVTDEFVGEPDSGGQRVVPEDDAADAKGKAASSTGPDEPSPSEATAGKAAPASSSRGQRDPKSSEPVASPSPSAGAPKKPDGAAKKPAPQSPRGGKSR